MPALNCHQILSDKRLMSLTVPAGRRAAAAEPPASPAHAQLRDDQARGEPDPKVQDVLASPVLLLFLFFLLLLLLLSVGGGEVHDEQDEHHAEGSHH